MRKEIKTTWSPWRPEIKSEALRIRLQLAEKEAFESAAKLVGLSLSSWVRVKLRDAAAKDIKIASRAAGLIPQRRKS